MTAAVLIGIISMTLLVVTAVAALHIVRQSASDAFRALERIESRHERSVQTLLDRLMTIKWEDFAVVQATNDGDEGGFISPREQKEESTESSESELRQIFSIRGLKPPSAEEVSMLEEDFPEEMGVKP